MLIEYQVRCKAGHRFITPNAPIASYGSFTVRGARDTTPAYLDACSDEVFGEVGDILDHLDTTRALTEAQNADLMQAIFGVACDEAPDGTQLSIGVPAPCPECGTREMDAWEPTGQRYTGPSFIVTHRHWQGLSHADKIARIREAAATWLSRQRP